MARKPEPPTTDHHWLRVVYLRPQQRGKRMPELLASEKALEAILEYVNKHDTTAAQWDAAHVLVCFCKQIRENTGHYLEMEEYNQRRYSLGGRV